jgi:exopolysaccharide biosynthesis operon protein EpsL
MRVQPRSWLTAALLVGFSSAPAWAQVADTFTLNAAYSRQTDSNLFRLPADANVNALIGKSSAAEQIGITSVGFNLNKAYSLQRFELDLNLVDNQYQNFSYLSFTAHNYNAAWRWSVTPRLHGNLTTGQRETLNSFTDYRGFKQRNQRTSTNTRLDAAYELDGNWQVLAGVAKSNQTNQQALVGESDYNTTSSDLGLRFAYASGSALSYVLKKSNGTNANRVLSTAGLSGDDFNQVDHELKLQWVASGKSVANFSAARINRTHPNQARRDYSGLTTAANLNWRLTGKTTLTAGWVRELSSFQSEYSNYTQTDRFSVGPVWQLSPKAAVRLHHEVAQRKDLGSPGGVSATQRSDTTRDTRLSFDWQPHQRLTLSAALQNATRVSSLAGLDYRSNTATFSAQFTY